MDPLYLDALAQLETAGGRKTIKGPGGEDSHNLFNIKDFSGKGFRAFDRAEKSNDAYRVYSSHEESKADLVSLLDRKYPAARTAKSAAEFAAALKAGGYATDPEYVKKFVRVYDGIKSALDVGRPIPAAAPRVPKSTAPAGTLEAAPEGFWQQATAAYHILKEDPRAQSYGILDRLLKMGEPPEDPNWVYDPGVEEGLTLAEVEYLREVQDDGRDAVNSRLAEIRENRGRDASLSKLGLPALLAGGLASQHNNIPGLVTALATFGVGSVAGGALRAQALGRAAGVAPEVSAVGRAAIALSPAQRLAAAGRPGAAVAAAVGEGLVVDTALAVADDTFGRARMTVEDYSLQIAAGAALGIAPELATLPASLRDAKRARLLERASESVEEVRAAAVHNEAEAVAHFADDTATNRSPTVTDAEAAEVNRLAVPEEPGQRLGGDPTLGRILREANDADETVDVAVPSERNAPKRTAGMDDPGARLSEGFLDPPKSRGEVIIDDWRRSLASGETPHPAGKPSPLYDPYLGDMIAAAERGDGAAFSQARQNLRLLMGGQRPTGPEAEFIEVVNQRGMKVLSEHAKGGALLRGPDGVPEVRLLHRFGGKSPAAEDANEPVVSTGSLREALTALRENSHVQSMKLGGIVEHYLERLPARMLDDLNLDLVLAPGARRSGVYHSGSNRTKVNTAQSNLPAALTYRERIAGLRDTWEAQAVVHEITHTITTYPLEVVDAIRRGKYAQQGRTNPEVPKEWHDLYDEAHALFARYRDALPASTTLGQRYALTDVYEFLSQGMSDPGTRMVLKSLKADSRAGGRFQNLWQQFKAMILRFLFKDERGTALEDLTVLMDRFIEARVNSRFVDAGGNAAPTARDFDAYYSALEAEKRADEPPQYVSHDGFPPIEAADFNSVTSAQARNFSDQINAAAEEWLRANPIDDRKLKTLAALAPDKMGALTTGLILARSRTPILRRLAALITETTTGAAGRKATVAVRRDMLATKLYSDAPQRYEDIANRWAREQGHGIKDRLFTGESRREFDRQVYLHVRGRMQEGAGERELAANPRVRNAADVLQELYQRSGDAQRAAGTVGNENLPRTSKGYIPQQLDSAKLAAASAEELRAVRQALVNHWVTENDWDPAFSKSLADLYIDRARERTFGTSSYGAKLVDSQGIGDVRTAVKGALDAGYVTKDQAAAAMLRLEGNIKRGQKSTRHRLDVPMTADIGPGKTMLDFFVTDQLSLAHRHVQTTAGEVALTEMGIPGKAGIERLRLAAVNATPAPTLAEMRAFDQVVAELFGVAPEGARYSETAQTLRLATGVLKLGGVVFNQLSETSNMIHAFGVAGALRQVASLPGHLLEVRAIAKGGQPASGLLKSIEAWGGEIGMGDYRVNFPLRAADSTLREYVNSPSVLSTLIKSASMVQHKISFMRGVVAAQHRATAEQILLKAARMIKDWDGQSAIPTPMQDMGFDPELVAAFKAQFARVAVFDQDGRLQSFNVQGVGNAAATEAFVQAVHRGTKQIIQGTFIGERNAWVHNDWINLMTQFRSFSITAMEKQWSRQRFSKEGTAVGYAYLGGLVLAQTAMALPIYAARVQTQALLMREEERQKFIDSRMNLPAMTRGVMNYSSSSGLLGDMLEYALMFGGKSAGIEGARGAGQADVVSSAIPALGALNQSARALGGAAEAALDDKEDNVRVDKVLKTLPFSSLWYVVPFINAAKD